MEDDERDCFCAACASKAAQTKAQAALKKSLAKKAKVDAAQKRAKSGRRAEEALLRATVIEQRHMQAEISEILQVGTTPTAQAMV